MVGQSIFVVESIKSVICSRVDQTWDTSSPALHIKGAFFWDYSVYSYFGIGLTEYTEYQFPIKQIARYSENRIADVIKKDWRGRAIFPPKYYSVHSATGSRMDGIVFRSFRNRNSSQKNTGTVYSGIGINGIVPKERALTFSCLEQFELRSINHDASRTSVFFSCSFFFSCLVCESKQPKPPSINVLTLLKRPRRAYSRCVRSGD